MSRILLVAVVLVAAVAGCSNGGVRLHDVRVSYLDDFDGAYVVATVTGSADDGSADDGSSREIPVPMSRIDGSYYIAFGESAPSGSEADPASPAP